MPENDPNQPPVPLVEQEEQAPADEGREHGAEAPPLSRRAMLLIGGGASVAAALVLGLSLLVGAPGQGGGRSDPPQAQPVGDIPGDPTAPVGVPQVVGSGSMTAVERLAARRLPLGGIIRQPSSQPAGFVLRSNPPAGTTVPGGTPVTLYVSAGQGGSIVSGRITVPYFIGLDESQARASAAALGLAVKVAAAGPAVRAQSPAPGSGTSGGATVTLTMG